MALDPVGELSPEQQLVARAIEEDAESLYVQACPGAGKTRTIVSAFLRLTRRLPPRHGVAVLSFTNGVADEIRKRCLDGQELHLCAYPNFVGTVDAFISRFLVVPFDVPGGGGKVPRIIESWERLGVQIIVRTGQDTNFIPVPLSAFGRNSEGLFGYHGRGVSPGLDKRVRDVVELAVKLALKRWKVLIRAGFLTCEDARYLAKARLEREGGDAAARAVAARFRTIIVDEAQDCSPVDVTLLQGLQKAGARVVVVADPDQSIYGFRDARPEVLRGATEAMKRYVLRDNFRSTRTICQVASSLRGERYEERASGVHANDAIPVVLVAYSGELDHRSGAWFLEVAERRGLRRRDVCVLAHGLRHALRAAGLPPPQESEAQLIRLANAVVSFQRSDALASARRHAVETVERLVVRRLGLEEEPQEVPLLPADLCEYHAISPRWLRAAAFRILAGLSHNPVADTAEVPWIERARHAFSQIAAPPGTPYQRSEKQLFPNNKDVRLPPLRGDSNNVRAMTVHEAKGREFDAALVVIPDDRSRSDKRTAETLAAWEARLDHEPRAVLYVAATRARRLLGFAVPDRYVERIAALLRRDGAECEAVAFIDAPVKRRTGSGRRAKA